MNPQVVGRFYERVCGLWRTRCTNLEPAAVLWLWWCAGLLAHYDDRMHWDVAPVITVSVALSIVGMLWARSPVVMLSVAALQVAAMWRLMPSVDNHWFFAAAIDVALIAATLTWLVRRRRLAPLDDDWYAIAAPVVRLIVLSMYAFAVFHKLNWGFLDPETSCGVHFYQRLGRTPLAPGLPTELTEAQGGAIVGAVLAVEAAIPLLLAGRRTWFLGIGLGIAFHLSTGMFMRHFPSLMYALYWVFVPLEVQRRWLSTVDRWLRRCTWGRMGFVAATVMHAMVWSTASIIVHEVLTASGMSRRAPESGYWWVLRGWNACVVTAALVSAVAFVRIGGAVPHPAGRFSVRPRWLIGIVLGFGLNCLSPYLGLKTSTSVAMWSNLVVTGGVSNHVLIGPRAIETFDFTSDVVRLVAVNDKKLLERVRTKARIPWITFRAEVRRAVRRAKKKDRVLRLSYERDGQRFVVLDASKNAALMARHPRWVRKLIKAKPARGDLRASCTW